MSLLRAGGRRLVEWAGALLSMPIVLALFVFWFLQVGPVPVPFLPAYLEQALSAAGGLTARIGRAFVAWEHTGPEIRLTDIRATDAGEAVSVAAASASIEFDLSALAAGELRPDLIELDRPSLAVKRRDVEDFPGMRQRLTEVLGHSTGGSAGDLVRIVINDGDIQLSEAKAEPSLRIAGIAGELEAGIGDLKGSLSSQVRVADSRAQASLTAAPRQEGTGVRLTLAVDGLELGAIAALFPELALARGVRVPASGKATFDLARNGTLEAASWDLTGSAGRVELPEVVRNVYHVDEVRLRGTYQDKTLHISSLSVAIGAAKVSMAGEVAMAQPGTMKASLEASAADVPVDDLRNLWPPSVSAPVRAWVTTNLHGGKMQAAEVALALSYRPGAPGPNLERLSGDMKMTGVAIDYLQGMPPARDVAATARFDRSAFRIKVLDGRVNDLRLERGEIDIGRLGPPTPAVHVDLHGRGAAAAALRLVTYQPLGQSVPGGIDLDRVKGDAKVRVSLDFDLPGSDEERWAQSLRWQAALGAERLDYGKLSPWVEKPDVEARGGAGKVTNLKVRAELLDAHPLLAAGLSSAGSAAPLRLELDIGRLRMENGRDFRNVRGKLVREDDLWKAVDVEAGVNSAEHVALQVKSVDGRAREVRASAKDAGQVLAALGVYAWMVGGEATLSGQIDPGGTVRGRISVEDYRVVNAPAMAKLLVLASLTGILDALRGEGLAFTRLKSDFVVEGRRITLPNFRAFGASLGLTAKGTLSTATGRIDIDGTLAPAYTISRVVKLIPLLGSRLVGKDEGLVAFTFTVSGRFSEPEVSLNPLSILVPSVLRQLLSVGTVDQPESEATPEAAPQ